MKFSNKAMEINPSITLEITAKAKELKELGVDITSFGAGEPDFNTPSNIIKAATLAMENGKTKYTATSGILELRQAICNKLKKENNLDYDPSQIIISTGAKQGLANTFLSILNPGDEVIIPTPYWVSYPELVKIAGGIPVYCNSKRENDYKYTLEELEEVLSYKTKAIVINSPNNPTGSIYDRDELENIAAFARKNDILIISDEIYEKLIYDGEKHISIASLSEDALNRTIIINGLSKSYAMTGWRIGYSASNKEIAKLMSSIQSHMTSNASSISQYGALEALTGDQDSVDYMVKEFDNRRKYMINRIREMKDISIIKPKGAFYIMVDISNYYGKSYNGKVIESSLDFAKQILEKEKVAVIPGIGFGLDKYIRLSYATSMEVIEKGLDRIEKFIKDIK
ncbi:pyridoxal phosphate-dependent aminotransferase [Clostridium sp.]|uniref:pyridoxal phosphate-dependent aminotransferase n=1 Tax=Clostridium sp. TaxID=1506 RepID=UPI0026254464|nr:pyridoxal phosphate-dependent aminotransferase [Clostridium sp.]